MDIFTRDDLEALVQDRREHSVSVYLPTHRGGSEEDPIRWRKHLQTAEEGLVAAGLQATAARKMLEAPRALLEDPLFWKNQSDGLALFLADGFMKLYRLPVPFAETVVVGRHFHVRPLLPLLSGDGRFFVLALSQNAVRLLQGTRFGVTEIDLKGVPASLAEALLTHDRDEMLTFHTRPSGGLGSWGAIYHGHGVGIDDKKDDVLRYFQKIDHGLRPLLKHEQTPLLLAGTDYLLPIYRKANTYPHLLEQGIEGNPDHLSNQDLHDKAWSLVQPIFQQTRKNALAQYEQLAGTGRTTCALTEVVAAASQGRIDALLLARDHVQWGRFDLSTHVAEAHDQFEPGDEDLLNLAGLYALRLHRSVHVFDVKEMPEGTVAAAVFCLPLAKHGKRPGKSRAEIARARK